MFGQVQKGINKVAKFSLKPKFLEETYPYRDACQAAAASNVAEVSADALDAEQAQTVAGKISTIAMMRCLGMSIFQIIMFFVVSLVVYIACMIFVMHKIPDRFWQNCKVCKDKNGKKSECRPGTPEECKRGGMIIELIIAAAVASILVGIIWKVFKFYLRLRVFNAETVLASTVVGALL